MNNLTRIKYQFDYLSQAISRLEEALAAPKTKGTEDFIRDATIQRFEFTIELFWKTLKKILNFEKINSSTPRDVIASAYQHSLISHEKQWLSMLDDRNLSSHIYSEEEAEKIYTRIRKYCPVLRKDFNAIKAKYNSYLNIN